MRIGGGAQQKQGGAACGPRAHCCAVNSAGGDGGTQKFGLEKFGCQIGYGHGAPAQQAHHVFFAEAADVATDFRSFQSSSVEGCRCRAE